MLKSDLEMLWRLQSRASPVEAQETRPLGGIVRVISPPGVGTESAQLLGREMKIKM